LDIKKIFDALAKHVLQIMPFLSKFNIYVGKLKG